MERVSEQDIGNVLEILHNFTATETSRMKINVAESGPEGQVQEESVVWKYHHGRCDVGSPWAQGKSFDVLE